MNAPVEPGTALATAIIMPREAQAAMALARDLSSARCIPSAFQKSPADVFMVMTICARYAFDFLPTIWECSIIKGRLFFSGKMTAAMLNASGYLAERLNYEYEFTKRGDAREVNTIMVTARINGETTPRTVHVRLDDVKTANENWIRNPEQQLVYAGARIWGRRHLPEVLLGLMFEGEMITVEHEPQQQPKEVPVELPKEKPLSPIEEKPVAIMPLATTHDAEPTNKATTETTTDQIEPFTIPRRGEDAADWSAWAQALMAYIRAAPDIHIALEWKQRNGAALVDLERLDTAKHKRLLDMIDHNIAMRREQDEAEK